MPLIADSVASDGGGSSAFTSGAPVAASTHMLVDRSSVRLSDGRVTTRDVGPLAVGRGLSVAYGEETPAGGTATCSEDGSTLTVDSWTAFIVRSSSSAVVAVLTLDLATLCDAAADTRVNTVTIIIKLSHTRY